jgi:GntR family transcriptional regulator, transcriptional repressor for pyruvate dehydrogenase complex
VTTTREAARTTGSRGRERIVDLPGIVPLTVSRLSDDLADEIRRLIISEHIAAGSRLPSERDLAERFGASRPTVSQALRTLSLMGLVEIRRGSGAYVLRRPQTMVTASVNLMLDLDQQSVTQLMQLRLWLETLGVQHAASRKPALTARQAKTVLSALERLTSVAGNPAEWIAADTVFHATVVRSAGNPYLAALYESVHTAILSYEYRNWVETESVPRWLRDMTPEGQRALHEPIARAVLDRDAEAAQVAVLTHHEVMAEHLEAARRSASRRSSARRRRGPT